MFQFLSLILSLCIIGLYAFTKIKHSYWKKRKIPYPEPTPFFGNYGDYILLKKAVAVVAQDNCRQFPNEPYIGTFYGTEPALLVQDPEILKLILTKDFSYFNSREISNYTHNEVLTQNLFFTFGDRWKVIRQNMTPVFTTAKLKSMFYLVEKSCKGLENLLDYNNSASDVIEVRTLAAKYTVETISSCGFGIEANALQTGTEHNPFVHIGETILDSSTRRAIKWIMRAMWPAVFYLLRLRTYSKDVDIFFSNLLTKVFDGRNYEPSSRNDFIDFILNWNKNKYITGSRMTTKPGEDGKAVLEVDNDLLVSSCVAFFAGGFETSATTLAYTLFELAKHKDIQRRAQEEIDQYLEVRGNKLGYDCVTDLPYTAACVDEALRLYPVLGFVTREVIEEYTLPTGLTLEKGLRLHVPIYHLHRDPANFPDPEEYRPERFLPENKHNIKPYTYLPFGEGPRICIGMRFAKVQMMTALVTILKKFTVELAPGVSEKVEYEPRALVTAPATGIPLKFTTREGWQQRVLK